MNANQCYQWLKGVWNDSPAPLNHYHQTSKRLMETRTQPVLCCLGGTEAGDPTQFVMERLFESVGVDWKVLTAEIHETSLSQALQGVLALNFNAVHFGAPFARQLHPGFLEGDVALQFIGALSSAMRCPDGWIGWHAWGPGVYRRFNSLCESADRIALLVGDSIENRSLAIALQETPPSNIYWWNAGNAQIDWLSLVSENNLPNQIQFLADPQEFASELRENAEILLAFSGERQIDEGALGISNSRVWFAGAPPQDLPEGARRMTEMDVTVASTAYDFEQWTGLEAIESIIRDAFEEYSAF